MKLIKINKLFGLIEFNGTVVTLLGDDYYYAGRGVLLKSGAQIHAIHYTPISTMFETIIVHVMYDYIQ